ARTSSLRGLPSVDAVLRHPTLSGALQTLPRPLLVESVRAEIGRARERLKGSKRRGEVPGPDVIAARAVARARSQHRPQLVRVLNATGIVLHTNLGRSPYSEAARGAIL